MKSIFIFFNMMAINILFAQSGPTTNQTVSWTEQDRITYYTNDDTPLDQISAIDRVVMEPRINSRSYNYVWDQDGLDYYEVTELNYLQQGDHFSFPGQKLRYRDNGSLERYTIEGVLLYTEPIPDFQGSAIWRTLNIGQVAPRFPIETGFSFVPVLDNTKQQELRQAGYNLVYRYPEYLKLAKGNIQIIVDAQTMTMTTIYYDEGGSLSSVNTVYYSQSEGYMNRIRAIDQYYRTMPSGLCVIRNTEKTYSNIQLLGDQGIEPRNAEMAPAMIFPNPTTGDFFISNSEERSMSSDIELYDATGRSISYTRSSNLNNSIRISPISKTQGIIIVKYKVDGKTYTGKVIILN